MSLEDAIKDNTKALQSIATSLAALVAAGKRDAAPAAEPVAQKAEAKAKPAAKAEKPLAEKTNADLLDEVLEEAGDDLLGGEVDDTPKLPAGERDVNYARTHLLPVLSKLKRPEIDKLLGKYGASKITEVPTDKWDEVYAAGLKLLPA